MDLILLKPALKDIIWGGTRLVTEFGYDKNFPRIAEAWVVSAHPAGQSTAAGGEFDGKPLGDILSAHPELCGEYNGDFPLLVKFIDAARDLSIQVHPDDKYAAAHENGRGKTEMWYVMDAAPGAFIYYGFKNHVTPKEFSDSIADGTVCNLLNKVECKRGDVFFIPAGTIHAIGAGLLICEIQQSSNLTYRIFDYNRPGPDGKPRELHIQKAAEASDLSPSRPSGKPRGKTRKIGTLERTVLARCDYFTSTHYHGSGEIPCKKTWGLITILGGTGEINGQAVKKGDGAFIPVNTVKLTLTGNLELIYTTP
ncbi:MAG TPA: class I mannose-6-phosphate isomerase [Oscillospiraceae bacterium]|nr:class I mannose-6-phosphate isomerase [Oscillospiraceae bacterium]HPF55393.1 class I mannose-6-phosphate isomerase [Clostridiales bacterium]HPK35605.1 class I mannose-6-phosphate isomerase [Oscillospiraceae bacterium]HPR74669.1 class I mannose-6-phosphate isomerase [Oscillospiraceae bacterium]